MVTSHEGRRPPRIVKEHRIDALAESLKALRGALMEPIQLVQLVQNLTSRSHAAVL